MGEVSVPFEIDPAYENLAAPKYFDFTRLEQHHDILAAESWFDMAPPDAVSPQVLSARAAGRSLAPMDMSPALTNSSANESQQLLAATRMSEDVSFAFPAPAVAAETTPGLPAGDKADKEIRKHTMQTRSLAKCNQGTPMDTDGVSILETPGSALLAKDLYSQLCSEADNNGHRQLGPSRLGPAARQPKPVSPQRVKPEVNGLRRKEPHFDREQPQQDCKRRKLEDGRLKQILNPRGPVLPARSTAPLTIPKEFHFRTKDRLRSHGGHDKENEEGDTSNVSLMESVKKFQTKTPKRFHSVPPQQNHPVVERTEMHLTLPVEPSFETAHRVRPTSVKSHEEMEEEEMERAPKFKAHPVDPKVLRGDGTLGVCPVPRHPLTETQEFHFETANRAARRLQERNITESPVTVRENTGSSLRPWDGNLTVAQEPNFETSKRLRPSTFKSREELEVEAMAKMPKFKARPLNKRIMGSVGELGVPRVAKRPVTEPKDPMLSTDLRALKRQAQARAEDSRPQQTNGAEAVQWDNSLTQPRPFPLLTEERGKFKEQQLQYKLAAEEEKLRQSRGFQAQPLPITTDRPQVLKKPQLPAPTKPKPFEMPGLHRHEAEQRRMAAERAERDAQVAAQKTFHAQPNLSKLLPPFIPEKSRRPLTQIQDVKLHIDSRAEERAEFDSKVQQRQVQAEQMRAKYEAERKVEEERQIKAMRKEMVPHARPMPHFNKPLVPSKSKPEKHSHVPPTTSAYDLRSRMR